MGIRPFGIGRMAAPHTQAYRAKVKNHVRRMELRVLAPAWRRVAGPAHDLFRHFVSGRCNCFDSRHAIH